MELYIVYVSVCMTVLETEGSVAENLLPVWRNQNKNVSVLATSHFQMLKDV